MKTVVLDFDSIGGKQKLLKILKSILSRLIKKFGFFCLRKNDLCVVILRVWNSRKMTQLMSFYVIGIDVK